MKLIFGSDIHGSLTAAKNVVVGHRDLMATACPGRKLYEKMQTIRGNAEWYRLH